MKSFISPIRLLILTFASLTATGQSYVPEEKNSSVLQQPVVDIKAFSFNLGEVKLLESEFRQAMLIDKHYLLSIEPDRLISQFRSHSGLEPKAPKYGGWEDSGPLAIR
jgi:uncharacterized protein